MRAKLAIAKCCNYDADEIAGSVVCMEDRLSVLRDSLKSGARVMLKPNMICAAEPDRHITTHPVFVEGIIKFLKEFDVDVVISDSPAFGSLKGVAAQLGLLDIVKKYGVKLDEFKHPVKVPIKTLATPGGVVLSRSAIEADLIINLPKLKAHVQMMFSGAVKNFYGCVPGKKKVWYHFTAHNDRRAFSEMLLRIYESFSDKSVSVVDGIVAMKGRGPRKGEAASVNMMLMGKDAVAIDSVLCKMLGVSESDYDIIAMAGQLGVGVSGFGNVDVLKIGFDELPCVDLDIPKELMDITFNLPRVIKSNIRHFFIKKVYEKLPRGFNKDIKKRGEHE